MTRILCWLSLRLLFVGLVPGCVAAQAPSPCRPADATSGRVLLWLTDVVTGTDPALVQRRTAMGLPQVPASQISYVTDKSVCSKAVTTYNSKAGYQTGAPGASEALSGRLYVFKVGTAYVANDPAILAGEFRIYVTMDKTYKLLWHGMGP
jgi:hypothetical protein